MDERGDSFTSIFVSIGRLFAEFVDAAVDVGVVAPVVVVHCRDHLRGLLRGGGIVEINKWDTGADFLIQNREVVPDSGHVKGSFHIGHLTHSCEKATGRTNWPPQ